MQKGMRYKIFIFLFPIAIILFFLILEKIISYRIYAFLIKEDSVVEYLQALFYFSAFIFTFLTSISFFKNRLLLLGILYGFLTVALLFVSLEEISWGQRIFSIGNPDYFAQHNVQNELTLHNLDTVQPILHSLYILIGFYGAFAWLFVKRFIPMAKSQCNNLLNYIIPDWFISSYFFFLFIAYILIDWFWIGWLHQELAELLLSLGFLFFSVINFRKSKKCLQ